MYILKRTFQYNFKESQIKFFQFVHIILPEIRQFNPVILLCMYLEVISVFNLIYISNEQRKGLFIMTYIVIELQI